jgi:hypothetical protein
MDDDAREPIGKIARTSEYSLYAQIRWIALDSKADREGKVESFDGYCLFLRTDLVAAGIDIAEGDLITVMGSGNALRNVNFYVKKITLVGHNPNYNGHTMIKAWLVTKQPVRHS